MSYDSEKKIRKLMKKNLLFGLVVILASLSTTPVTMAQPSTSSKIETSAGGTPTLSSKVGSVSVMSVSPMSINSADILVTSVLMPTKISSSWAPAADSLVADVRAGTLSSRTFAANPTQYVLCNNRLSWSNLVYSESTSLWGSELNPPPPFNMEFGLVVWNVVDMRSKTGADDISLDMLSFGSFSNDGNYLGATYTFVGMTYTVRAIVIKSDGTVTSSGSTSQKGARVIVLVFLKLFNGGATQAGLNEVRDWVGGISDFSVSYTAQIIGNDATRSYSRISAVSVPRTPIVKIGNASVAVANGESGTTYQIFSSQHLPGAWQFEGVVNGTDPHNITQSGFSRYFRAKVQ